MKAHKLLSVHFLVALLLLLLNDFYLKAQFHNGLTGKLSDVAGLFAFAYFFSVLFSGKSRWVHIGTALFFIWFKSPASQFALDWVNSFGVFQAGRIVDYWDLIAIAILPVSYHLVNKELYTIPSRWLSYPIAGLSFFAFCATTQIHEFDTIVTPPSEAAFAKKLEKLDITYRFFDDIDTLDLSHQKHSYYNLEIIDTPSAHLQSIVDTLIIGNKRKLDIQYKSGKAQYETTLEKLNLRNEELGYWQLPYEAPLVVTKDGVSTKTTVSQAIYDDRFNIKNKKKLILKSGLEYQKFKSPHGFIKNDFMDNSMTVYSDTLSLHNPELMNALIDMRRGNGLNHQKIDSLFKKATQ